MARRTHERGTRRLIIATRAAVIVFLAVLLFVLFGRDKSPLQILAFLAATIGLPLLLLLAVSDWLKN